MFHKKLSVMRNAFVWLTLSTLLPLMTLLAACAPVVPAAPPSSTGDSPAGELVVYTARSEALFKPVIDAFNKRYPNVTVTMLSGKNGELAAKILEEQANPQADLFVNTDSLIMQTMAAEGAFEPNSSANVMAVPADLRAEDGNWVSLTLRPRVIMYNTDLVKPEELPTSIFDLTDPKWKGQVGAADSTNGAIIANLVAIRSLLGEEKMVELVQGLVANQTQFFGGHTEVRKAVGAGELKLGFVNHYYYHLSKAEGAPVGVIYPDQGEGELGLVVNSTNAGIIQGAKHKELAVLLIDFMLSAEGQKIYADLNFEYPVLSNVAVAAGVEPLSNFKLAKTPLNTLWQELDATQKAALAAGLP